MPDDGFNFRPVERREAKSFVPPPWERDRFDELARRRAEQEAREREAEEARLAAVAAVTAAAAVATAAAAAPTQPALPADAAPGDARVETMLAELAAEEPGTPEKLWKANVVVGAALAVFGCVFLIWGIAALVAIWGAGTAGMIGGSVMLLFGAGFVFGGLYVVARSLRQRGVL